MQYVYKNHSTYIYKRRIPTTDKIYIFNLTTKNYKKATKISILFNKLTFDIFNHIKTQGQSMQLDFEEVANILNNYKDKALDEYKDLETKRHNHLGQLFKIQKQDPLMGSITLNGADKEVIQEALKSFHNLALCNFEANKKAMLKIGKEVVSRATPEIKNLFAALRNNTDNLLTFLSLLFKAEAQVLQIDYQRAENRFNPSITVNNQSIQSEYKSFSKEDNKKGELLENIINNFLYNHCGYPEEDINNSKSQCYKTSKMTELFYDYIKHNKNNTTTQSIDLVSINNMISMIIDIPKKQGNHKGTYNYYQEYRKVLNTEYDKRGVTTIKSDLQNLNRFIQYLRYKKIISSSDFEDTQIHYDNTKKHIDNQVKNEILRDKKDCEAFKPEMIHAIFNETINPYYKTTMDILTSDKTLRSDYAIETYLARFYVPLILLFTGARVDEMSYIKVEDCEVQTLSNNKERLILYVLSNEQRKLKTRSSRRMIVIHDFLAYDLNLINFIKKAKKSEREYLFYVNKNISEMVTKEFNRINIKDSCITPFLTKEDLFKNSKYSLHSLRHNFKTNLTYQGLDKDIIKKIQGHSDNRDDTNYISTHTNDIATIVNKFDLHTTVEWDRFKVVSVFISKI